MCVALAALEAVVEVTGPKGERKIPFRDFHRLPGDTPHIETNLQPGELITAVDLPPVSQAPRSYYLKARDRHSYAFPLVSVAAVLDVEGQTIRQARIGLGGVAMKPWRAEKAEKIIAGKQLDPALLRRAAEEELRDARGYQYNSFKIELAKRCIPRAVQQAFNQPV
jgi:xanthine dehydrogenase YagS FAD-binding subunit